MDFSISTAIEELEHLVYSRQYEPASRTLLAILNHLEVNGGGFGNIGTHVSFSDRAALVSDTAAIARLASAITALFMDRDFILSEDGYFELVKYQRWFTVIFGASPFRNADHIIHHLNLDGYLNKEVVRLSDSSLLKFALLYSLDSSLPLNPELLWSKDMKFSFSFFMSLLSAKTVISDAAIEKRDKLLTWLPEHIKELSMINSGVFSIMHDVMMHCSYSSLPGKHRIKRALYESVIRPMMLKQGFYDLPSGDYGIRDGRPVIMVVLEWFHSGHSTFRTKSRGIAALRDRYFVIGAGRPDVTDETSRKVFDEFVPIDGPLDEDRCRNVLALAERERPVAVYYPAIGMFPETIRLSSLRLASVQMMSFGHAASSFSPVIDYFLVNENLLGSPEVFTERLVTVPGDGMPFVPRASMPEVAPHNESADISELRVCVPAAIMKLNAPFLRVLSRIQERSRVKIRFQFNCLFARGFMKTYIEQQIHDILPDAIVCPELPLAEYLEALSLCGMYVSPFPYGSTNTIVDTTFLGLLGVCMSGPEIHAHIDEGLFARAGLPDWLVAHSEEEYVEKAVRLAEDVDFRAEWRQKMVAGHVEQLFYEGRPETFADAVQKIVGPAL